LPGFAFINAAKRICLNFGLREPPICTKICLIKPGFGGSIYLRMT